MTELLRTVGLRKRFGEFAAIDGVDLVLRPATLTAVIGPNGAGKTTLINLVTGGLIPDAGQVFFNGEEMTALPTHQRVRKGVSRSFQLMNIFPRLTLSQNLLIPILARRGRTMRPFSALAREREALDEARQILKELGLESLAELSAGA